MQRDAWRTYLELALGLTEASRKKAKKAIKSLVNQSGASVDQVKSLTEELVETSVANREAIAKMVRGELDRALSLVGLASSEEVAELNERIATLERRLQEAETTTPPAAAPTPADPVTSAPAKAAAKKTAAKKAAPTKAAPAKTAATKTAAKKTTAKKAVAKKTPAKTTPAKTASPAKTTPPGASDTPEAGNTQ